MSIISPACKASLSDIVPYCMLPGCAWGYLEASFSSKLFDKQIKLPGNNSIGSFNKPRGKYTPFRQMSACRNLSCDLEWSTCFPMAGLIAWAYGQYIMVIVLTVLEMKTGIESLLCLCVSLSATFFLALFIYILLEMPICKIWV